MGLTWRRSLLGLGIFTLVALAALLARGLQLNPRELPSPLVGRALPTLVAPALAPDAPTVDSRHWTGQPTLLNVWASWCAPCEAEHPLLLQLAKDAPGLRLVGLNYKDQGPAARQWLVRLGNPYSAVAVDERGQLGLDLGVYGVPETFVVDARGQVLFKHVGPLTPEVLARVRRLLALPTPP